MEKKESKSFDKFYKELKNGKYKKDKPLIIAPTRIPKLKKINFFEFMFNNRV